MYTHFNNSSIYMCVDIIPPMFINDGVCAGSCHKICKQMDFVFVTVDVKQNWSNMLKCGTKTSSLTAPESVSVPIRFTSSSNHCEKEGDWLAEVCCSTTFEHPGQFNSWMLDLYAAPQKAKCEWANMFRTKLFSTIKKNIWKWNNFTQTLEVPDKGRKWSMGYFTKYHRM